MPEEVTQSLHPPASTLPDADPAAGGQGTPADPPGFELLEQVGAGGMGTVHRARDLALGRDVAVKLLKEQYPPGGVAARRFVEEGRITGQLQHPGIPAVYHVGALPDGRPFLAMKLVKGQTVAHLLKHAPDRGRLVAAFEQLCQAVGYAHAHGVIHRDLKPDNVMVGAFGEVQVMDWGLAKVLGDPDPVAGDPELTADSATEILTSRDEGDATRAGSILGTPAYMAPEQAIGAVGQLDARTDVFGLGAVLCVVLTGQPPYVGGDAETTRQMAARGKQEDAFARLDGCGADPDLVALCKRCLAPEKGDRPADAGQVAAAVAALRQAADDRARRAELSAAEGRVREAEGRKRRRLLLTAGGVVAGVLLAGGAVAGGLWRRAEAALVKVTAQEQATADALAVARDEQAKSAAALAREEQATAGTRAGLLGWLRQRAGERNYNLSFELRRKQEAEELLRLRKFCDDALAAMPAGRDRLKLEAEFARLFGDIARSEGYFPDRTSRAALEYATAARLTRQLLADEPTSEPLRRQLADCLYELGQADRYLRSYRLSAGAAAVVGGTAGLLVTDLEPKLAAADLAAARESLAVREGLLSAGLAGDREMLAKTHRLVAELLGRRPTAANRAASGDALRAEMAVYDGLLGPDDGTPAARARQQAYLDEWADCVTRLAEHVGATDVPAGLALVARAEAAHDKLAGVRGWVVSDFSVEKRLTTHCRLLARGTDHAALFATATKLQECIDRGQTRRPGSRADAAWYLARCVGLAQADQKLAPAERTVAAERYTRGAVDVLARLLAADPTAFREVAQYASVFATLGTDPRFRELVRKHLPPTGRPSEGRCTMLLMAGQPERAAADALTLAAAGRPTAGGWYNLGCILSIASGQSAGRRDEYAGQAVALLRRAEAAGWADVDHMATDADLDPLRGRFDYRWLVARMATRPRSHLADD